MKYGGSNRFCTRITHPESRLPKHVSLNWACLFNEAPQRTERIGLLPTDQPPSKVYLENWGVVCSAIRNPAAPSSQVAQQSMIGPPRNHASEPATTAQNGAFQLRLRPCCDNQQGKKDVTPRLVR